MHKSLINFIALLSVALGGIGVGSANQTRVSIRITNGTVIDGTGASRRRADMRIEGDRISEIGKLTPRAGERVIDARGLVVAPGFIDTHSHADGGLLGDPDAETQIRQGITTAVVGQDGGSNTPLDKYFQDLEAKHVALNIASFTGHGTIRKAVLGEDYKRPAQPDEVAAMQAIVEREMRAGALGLSSGLEYDPGFYSTTKELAACAEASAKYHGMYISHVRDEGNEAIKSFKELIEIAERAHLPAQISHIKLDTKPSWGKAGEVLKLIEESNRRGLDISADVYPYTFWQSTITVLIPTRDWDDRAAWENGLDEIGGAGHVRLTRYSPDQSWEGKTIAELAMKAGTDPVSVIQEIVRKTHGPGVNGSESVVVEAMQASDLDIFIRSPRIMFCTDGGLKPTHPRGAGTYPRILGRYVRERHLLSMEEAIRKMTSLPAKRMGFADRGTLRPGMKADVVLFDPKSIIDTSTIQHPSAPPVGIDYVLVNGKPVLDRGVPTGSRPGEVIRSSGIRK